MKQENAGDKKETGHPPVLLPQREEKGGCLPHLLPGLSTMDVRVLREVRPDISCLGLKQKLWVVPLVPEL